MTANRSGLPIPWRPPGTSAGAGAPPRHALKTGRSHDIQRTSLGDAVPVGSEPAAELGGDAQTIQPLAFAHSRDSIAVQDELQVDNRERLTSTRINRRTCPVSSRSNRRSSFHRAVTVSEPPLCTVTTGGPPFERQWCPTISCARSRYPLSCPRRPARAVLAEDLELKRPNDAAPAFSYGEAMLTPVTQSTAVHIRLRAREKRSRRIST